MTDQDEPFLIDFAHTGIQAGPVDPVSLELSLIFHPRSSFGSAISEGQCERWLDDGYAVGMPRVGPIVAECRRWATNTGHDERSQVVATLLYALWILSHAAQPGHALALARAAANALRA